jgi:hypothetical protein
MQSSKGIEVKPTMGERSPRTKFEPRISYEPRDHSVTVVFNDEDPTRPADFDLVSGATFCAFDSEVPGRLLSVHTVGESATPIDELVLRYLIGPSIADALEAVRIGGREVLNQPQQVPRAECDALGTYWLTLHQSLRTRLRLEPLLIDASVRPPTMDWAPLEGVVLITKPGVKEGRWQRKRVLDLPSGGGRDDSVVIIRYEAEAKQLDVRVRGPLPKARSAQIVEPFASRVQPLGPLGCDLQASIPVLDELTSNDLDDLVMLLVFAKPDIT